MKVHRQLFSAVIMGIAGVIALPALAQQEQPAEERQGQADDQAQPEAQQAPQQSQQRRSQAQQQESQPQQGQEREAQSQQQQTTQQRQRDTRQQSRLMLGVGFAEDADFSQGLEIGGVMPGSAAAQANLQRGDTIVSINGQEVRSAEELDRIVQQQSIGDTADLVILRNGQRQQVQVTFIEAPEADSQFGARRPDLDGMPTRDARRGWLGVTLSTEDQGRPGVGIRNVYPAGPAARAGLQPGDEILQVAGQQVSQYEQILEILAGTQPGDSVDLLIAAGGQQQQVSVRLDDAGVFNTSGRDDFDSTYMWRDPSGRTAEIPEHDMMLEQHRHFAQQHQRIEELLMEVKQDLEQIKQQLNIQPAQGRNQPPQPSQGRSNR